MAISYPLAFPSLGIKNITIRARSVVGVASSPFTFQQQVYQHAGQMWEAEITMPPMKREDAEQLIAFLLKLNGSYGTFTFGDPLNTSPRGVGTGTPLVNGGSQTGIHSLRMDGLLDRLAFSRLATGFNLVLGLRHVFTRFFLMQTQTGQDRLHSIYGLT